MRIRVRDVQLATAEVLRVPVRDLRGPAKHKAVLIARQVAMLLARELTGQSFPFIGFYFGRDHSTVHHGVRKARQRIAESPHLAQAVAEIRARVPARAEAFHAWKATVATDPTRQLEHEA